jgi:HupE / UreJ protein
MMLRRLTAAWSTLAALAFAFAVSSASAHKPSDSYLTLQVDGEKITGQWDIALRDLDLVLDLDRNADAAIDWGEVRARHPDIATYALSRLTLTAVGSAAASGALCSLAVTEHMIDTHTDGAYAVLKLAGRCPTAVVALGVKYSLLFDVDAQHRGLLKLESRGAGVSLADAAPFVLSAVFPLDNAAQTLALAAPGGFAQFLTYVADGIKHIAIGIDHILFLIALLLPAVLRRNGREWVPVDDLSAAFWNVLKIVTAFTVAHSITLSLAVLEIVQLPSRFVESAIAASVLITALDNLWPFLPRKRWLVAFAFGLLHGFGFASVLIDLKLPASALLLSLFGFNVGVELGQLMLVAVLVPLAYVSRATKSYTRIVLGAGSMVIAAISLGWLLERSLALKLMPF